MVNIGKNKRNNLQCTRKNTEDRDVHKIAGCCLRHKEGAPPCRKNYSQYETFAIVYIALAYKKIYKGPKVNSKCEGTEPKDLRSQRGICPMETFALTNWLVRPIPAIQCKTGTKASS